MHRSCVPRHQQADLADKPQDVCFGHSTQTKLENNMSKALKAQDSALILIDHQIISMSMIKTQALEIAKHNNIALVKAAKILGVPRCLDQQQRGRQQGLVDARSGRDQPRRLCARIKRTGIINSWNDPDFVSAVEATGRHSLIMAGTTNDGCLLYTALSARRAGYEVHAVLDAGGSPFQISEDAARLRMMQGGIVLTATNTLLGELADNWALPHGQQIRLFWPKHSSTRSALSACPLRQTNETGVEGAPSK